MAELASKLKKPRRVREGVKWRNTISPLSIPFIWPLWSASAKCIFGLFV